MGLPVPLRMTTENLPRMDIDGRQLKKGPPKMRARQRKRNGYHRCAEPAGQKVGSLELAEEVFGAVNEDLLWESVQHYRAAQRAGTHATKNRKLVSGSGKKLWRQKGRGGPAWAASVRRSAACGTVHGPQPRSYDYAFPRKKLLGALRSALAAKFADGNLIVIDSLDLKEAKTKRSARRWRVQVQQDRAGGGSRGEPESEPGTFDAQHRRG